MRRHGFWPWGSVALVLALTATPAAAQYTPARLKSGDAPVLPPNSANWVWDVAAVRVGADGKPTAIGSSGAVRDAVSGWSFEPARDDSGPAEGHALVAACYRAAVLMAGPEGQAPRAATPPDVPSPTNMVPPPYPPNALSDGVVVVELAIDASGAVTEARTARSAAGFDGAALEAARQWRFRPAQRAGVPVPAYVYLIFGFRQPVT